MCSHTWSYPNDGEDSGEDGGRIIWLKREWRTNRSEEGAFTSKILNLYEQ